MLYSQPDWQNTYSRICFTYILVNLLSVNYQPINYRWRVGNPSSPITDNLRVPDAFYPYLTKKCIFGISHLKMVNFPIIAEATIKFSGTL
jgi:hypothetical protein